MSDPPDTTSTPQAGGHRTLVENFPNGVLVLFDDAFQYRIVGPEILPFSRREASKMVGKTLSELFPEETVVELKPEFRATIEGDSRSFDISFEGRIHHIETKPAEIDGEQFGILVTQAVTEEREREQKLGRQNERLDQFATMVSHDLRNPLMTASGKLALYRETGDESALDDVEMALDRIDDITADLLTLVRSDPSSREYTEISLEAIVRQAWEMSDTRDATLEVSAGMVTGDRGQLQVLFENLIRNAVGHGGADVTARIGPLKNGFYFEDTGTGIPEENREKVFDHGFSTGYSGSGVGLTIVKRIAETHGWGVTLRESSEGGARFEFAERSRSSA